MKFEYLEVRPCIEMDDETTSYIDEVEFEATRAALAADDAPIKTYWSLYGRFTEPSPVGKSEFLACAIGDFTTKEDAHKVMNAILAPMAAARDTIHAGQDRVLDTGMKITAAVSAACDLEDFINQSSNMERI